MKDNQYIPALRFSWLTYAYDWIVRHTLPEKEFKTELIEQIEKKTVSTVLDFGVGTATLSVLLKENYPNVHVTGIDVDAAVLQIASEKIKKYHMDVDLVRYDGNTLPFPDQTFDRVVSSLVFHHLRLEDKKKALSELYRVLSPAGELHIADWGKPSNIFFRFLAGFLQVFDGVPNTCDNVNGRLPSLIEEAGFSKATITKSYNTIFGTLTLIRAIK